MAVDRSSEAGEPLLLTDKDEIARVEAENTLKQFDAAMQELHLWLTRADYRLRPSTIQRLNRIALMRLSRYAGIHRPGDITIKGSWHQPVPAEDVPSLLEDFCDYINDSWHDRSAVHLAAYALWRLNWIHPFVDGNGRTSRIVAYIILCARIGYRLPGIRTIPEQIAADKQPYYQALEAADRAEKEDRLDLGRMERLLDDYLAGQLVAAGK